MSKTTVWLGVRNQCYSMVNVGDYDNTTNGDRRRIDGEHLVTSRLQDENITTPKTAAPPARRRRQAWPWGSDPGDPSFARAVAAYSSRSDDAVPRHLVLADSSGGAR